MTTQDERQRERRLDENRGFAAMLLGVLLIIAAAVRDDDYSWQGYLLAGASLLLGGFFLFRALRH
jgi:hypothetical protein